MITLESVGYVRLGTRDLEGAAQFATSYLGLEVAEMVAIRSFQIRCT